MRYFNSPSYNSTMEGLDVTTSATPPAEKPMPPCRHAAATFPFVLIPTHSSYKQLSAGPPFPDSPAAAAPAVAALPLVLAFSAFSWMEDPPPKEGGEH